MFEPSSTYQVPNDLFLLNPNHAPYLLENIPAVRLFENAIHIGGCVMSGLISLFLIIPICLLLLGISQLMTWSALAQSGITTNALVTSHHISDSKGVKGGLTHIYSITYQFSVGQPNSDNPASYSHEQQVSLDTYNGVSDGGSIQITYLPTDPNTSRVLNDYTVNPWIILLMALVSFVLIGGAVMARLGGSRRTRRLRQEGKVIGGQITQAQIRQMRGHYQLGIRYRFQSPEGLELSKVESFVRDDLEGKEPPAVGTPVAIMYVNPKVYRVL